MLKRFFSGRSFPKRIVQIAGTLFAATLAGYLALVAVYCLPIGPMRQNLQRSAHLFDSGWGMDHLIDEYDSTHMDHSTDCYMLMASIYESDETPFEKAVLTSHTIYKGYNEHFSFILNSYGDENEELEKVNVVYPRYWHGYLVVLKPLLLLFDWQGLLMLNNLLQPLLLCLVVLEMVRKGLGRFVVPLAVCYFTLTPLALMMSLQHSTIYYVTMSSAYLLLRFERTWVNEERLPLFFLLVGIAACYFDFLTYPIATLGIPLVLALLMLENRLSGRKMLAQMFLCFLFWGVGYGGIWACKWLLLAMAKGFDSLKGQVFSELFIRLSNTSGDVSFGRLSVILRNLGPYQHKLYALAAGIPAVAFVIQGLRRHTFSRTFWRGCVFYLLAACLPVVWYMVVSNHSYVHVWLTHRAWAISVFAGLCMLARLCPSRGEARPLAE